MQLICKYEWYMSAHMSGKVTKTFLGEAVRTLAQITALPLLGLISSGSSCAPNSGHWRLQNVLR